MEELFNVFGNGIILGDLLLRLRQVIVVNLLKLPFNCLFFDVLLVNDKAICLSKRIIKSTLTLKPTFIGNE